MKTVATVAASAIAILGVSAAGAAENGSIVKVLTHTISPAHQTAYETAIKNYDNCLRDHRFPYAMIAYEHQTGDTYKYSFSERFRDWSDLDKYDDVVRACEELWALQGNAHLDGETSLILAAVPELSYEPKTGPTVGPLVHVTSFTLASGHESDLAFTAAIRKIGDAARKSNWTGNFMVYEVRGGDSGAPHYVLISVYKGWAEYGSGGEKGAWNMVEAAIGAPATNAIRKSIGDNVAKVSSHVESYVGDLSYRPVAN